MNRLSLGILPLTWLALGFSAGAADPRVEEIKNNYRDFKTAIVEHDGDDGVQLTCEATIDYYGELADLALYASAEELGERPLVDQLSALSVRHRVPAKELREMTAKELLSHSMDNGWVFRNVFVRTTLGAVRVEDQTAEAKIMVRGRPTGELHHFCYEDDVWKLDLASVFEQTAKQLVAFANQNQMTDPDAVLYVLERLVGEQVGRKIWKPPLKRKAS